MLEQPTQQPTQLDQLAYDYICAKQAEDSARKTRIAIEERIAEAITLKDEGTASEAGGFYKVSVVTGYTRKIVDAQSIAKTLGPELFEMCVRTKYELNISGLKKLGEDHRAALTRFVESKPKKPAVKVEELKV